jgi:hypothetical protein
MRRVDKGSVNARHGEGLQLMLILPLRQGTELVGQVGEQQGAKRGIAGNQVVHSLLGQLIRHHLLGCHEAAAHFACHQPPTVEAVVRAERGQRLVAIKLLDEALDDDKQVSGLSAQGQNGLALGKIGNIHAVANQTLLFERQTVKRGGRKIESTWHARYFPHSPCTLLTHHPHGQDAGLVPARSIKPGIPLQIGS